MQPSTSTVDNTATVYRERLDRYRQAAAAIDKHDDQIGIARIACAVAVGVSLYLGYMGWPEGVAAAIIAVLAFIVLSFYHAHVAEKVQRARRLVQFYEAGLRRIDGTWRGRGTAGARFLDPHHPYAVDLDIFGEASLFELLCTARTKAGEEHLAALLSASADAPTIRRRQEASREIGRRLDLRENVALLGKELRSRVDPAGLEAWGKQPPQLPSTGVRALATVVALANVACIIGWVMQVLPYWPFLVSFAVGRLYERAIGDRLIAIVKPLRRAGAEFEFLASMLACFEKEKFESSELTTLGEELRRNGRTASLRIGRFSTIVGLLDSTANVLFAILAPILLWTSHCAFAVEKWRMENGGEVGLWVDVIGRFEAAIAIGGFAYEHSEYPYPAIAEANASVYFDAVQLGHPLIPPDKLVRNDIRLDENARLFIVSGSNMSGKSTLMRSIGVNAVLGMAGAPVDAHSLALQPRSIGASITTNDSLQGGVSRFYAEIQRLRQIVDIASSGPALFLLDEILHGTNSHDRRIGAEAVIRTLLSKGAVGLATTHDLAISQIAGDQALAAVNVHFEDQLVDGRMSFDYKLRDGVVQKSNALALMRAVGLDVSGVIVESQP